MAFISLDDLGEVAPLRAEKLLVTSYKSVIKLVRWTLHSVTINRFPIIGPTCYSEMFRLHLIQQSVAKLAELALSATIRCIRVTVKVMNRSRDVPDFLM